MDNNELHKKIDEFANKKGSNLKNFEKVVNDKLKEIAEEITNES